MAGETVWMFKTARFTIALEIEPEEMDPADSFEFQEDVDAVRDGSVEWFCAVVAVYVDGNRVAFDSLGGCAYKSVREFYVSHRDRDPMNRNCSAMRAACGGNVVICHYFPDMVRQAVAEARNAVSSMPAMRGSTVPHRSC